MIKSIDGAVFSRMMLSAAAEIDLNKQKVNELNVFPVPDGDTGTNMSMTLNAASTELRRAENVTLTKAADMTASALLRGARGNSGVILSLLFRGFSKALKGKLEADGRDFAAALTAGVEAAYKAVMKPAEGTILTVSRLTADAARDLAEEHGVVRRVDGDAGAVFGNGLHAVAAGHANDAVGRGSRDCLTFGAHAELHAAGVCHVGDDNGLAGFFERLFHRFDFRRAAGLAGGGAQPAADDRDGFRLADQSQNLLQRLFLCNNHEM